MSPFYRAIMRSEWSSNHRNLNWVRRFHDPITIIPPHPTSRKRTRVWIIRSYNIHIFNHNNVHVKNFMYLMWPITQQRITTGYLSLTHSLTTVFSFTFLVFFPVGMTLYIRYRQVDEMYKNSGRRHLIFFNKFAFGIGLLAAMGVSIVANFQVRLLDLTNITLFGK